MIWRKTSIFIFIGVVAVFSAAVAQAVTIDFVEIGNTGNTGSYWNDSTNFAALNGRGAVNYKYLAGKFEVTVAQYVEFLNATAKTDTSHTYWSDMYAACGIYRNGTEGNYTYTIPKPARWANRPVNWVTWGSAARFCNWLHNGQPTTGVQDASTTEDGAYTLNGGTTSEFYATVDRNAGAKYFLPTIDEWYKAAFHKNDGDTGNYWRYATQVDNGVGETNAPSNILSVPDDGNSANYRNYQMSRPEYTDSLWKTTPVGSFTFSESAYGTFDQNGNVAEWTEKKGTGTDEGGLGATTTRLTAGGCYDEYWNRMSSHDTYLSWTNSGGSGPTYGFRVFGAVAVPEPGTIAMLLMGAFGLALFAWKRR